MSCEAGGKVGRSCMTHGLPLYPDGMCNEGRDAMEAKKNGPAYYPTPKSGLAPVSVPIPTPRASGVRVIVSEKDRAKALETLRTMRERYGATFRAHDLEGVLTVLEQEGY